jgi:inner membrane protein
MVWKDAALQKKYTTSLSFSSFYLLLSCSVKLYALNKFEKALNKQGIHYSEIIVKPTAFNIILWNANVATTASYLLADYSLLDSQSITFTTYNKNKALESQLRNSDFKTKERVKDGILSLKK